MNLGCKLDLKDIALHVSGCLGPIDVHCCCSLAGRRCMSWSLRLAHPSPSSHLTSLARLAMPSTIPSALLQSSCAFASPSPQRSSLPAERWVQRRLAGWLGGKSARMVTEAGAASLHVLSPHVDMIAASHERPTDASLTCWQCNRLCRWWSLAPRASRRRGWRRASTHASCRSSAMGSRSRRVMLEGVHEWLLATSAQVCVGLPEARRRS